MIAEAATAAATAAVAAAAAAAAFNDLTRWVLEQLLSAMAAAAAYWHVPQARVDLTLAANRCRPSIDDDGWYQ